ncbi:MAG: enoyl-CoA hydratase/isomerase family protein [Methylocystaceae bacterium]
MEYQYIRLAVEDGFASMTIDRPEAYNAVNEQVLIESAHALDGLARDEKVRAIILGGEGKFFIAGADVKEIIDYNPVQAERYISLCHIVLKRLHRMPKPTVAAISGLALGGGLEMTLSCDIRIAADNAVFGLPEINLGILPGGGGTQLLSRIVGMGRAKEIVLLGEFFNAKTALEIGLVSKVVAESELMAQAKKVAGKLARKPPVALRMAKGLVSSSMDVDVANGMVAEKEAFAMLFSTHDQKEGMRAFLEGRKAQFKGE